MKLFQTKRACRAFVVPADPNECSKVSSSAELEQVDLTAGLDLELVMDTIRLHNNPTEGVPLHVLLVRNGVCGVYQAYEDGELLTLAIDERNVVVLC